MKLHALRLLCGLGAVDGVGAMPTVSAADMIRSVASLLFLALIGCTGPRQLSSSGAEAYEASLASGPGRSAVAWYDTRNGNAEIYAREVSENGRGVGAEYRLTSDSADSYEADIVLIRDAFAVAWYEQTADGNRHAKMGVWSPDFEPRWTMNLSSVDRDSRIPVVRTFEDRIFCAWIETPAGGESEIWAGWWDLQGHAVLKPRMLAAAGSTTWNLNAAIDLDGIGYLVFDAQVGTRSEELFLVRVGESGSELRRITADDGFASKYPDLALTPEGAALTWIDARDGNEEVYLFVGSLIDLSDDVGVRARRVTESKGESIGAYVAWNGDRVGLAWSDNSAGQHEVYFQSFGSSGNAISDPDRLTRNRSDSLIPAIQPVGDGFMLTWNEFLPDSRETYGSDTRSEIVVAVISAF